MPYAIRLSSFPNGSGPEDFRKAVEHAIAELTAWETREAEAARGADVQRYPRPEIMQGLLQAIKSVQQPDGSIKHEPDFVVVDDTVEVAMEKARKQAHMMRMRRADLRGKIARAEEEELEKILPQGRRRLLDMKIAAVRKRDEHRSKAAIQNFHARADDHERKRAEQAAAYNVSVQAELTRLGKGADLKGAELNRHILEKCGKYTDHVDAPIAPLNLQAEVEGSRPKEDCDLLARKEELQAKIDQVQKHAAEEMDRLEDVPDERLDSWVMNPFPTLT
jgi:hypothetical protein